MKNADDYVFTLCELLWEIMKLANYRVILSRVNSLLKWEESKDAHTGTHTQTRPHAHMHTRAHVHTRTRTHSSVHDKHPPSRLPWLVWVPSSLNQSFRKRHLSHHMRYFWTESMRWKVKEKEKWERKHFSFYSHSNIKQWETIFKLQWLLSTRNFYCDF